MEAVLPALELVAAIRRLDRELPLVGSKLLLLPRTGSAGTLDSGNCALEQLGALLQLPLDLLYALLLMLLLLGQGCLGVLDCLLILVSSGLRALKSGHDLLLLGLAAAALVVRERLRVILFSR